MKPGDLVLFKNLDKSWGKMALITSVIRTKCGTGQISLLSTGKGVSIPWHKRHHFMEIINEDR